MKYAIRLMNYVGSRAVGGAAPFGVPPAKLSKKFYIFEENILWRFQHNI